MRNFLKKNKKKMVIGTFLFFLIKGLLWLIIPAITYFLYSTK